MILIWARFKNHQVTVIAEHLKHKAAGVTLCSELLRGLVPAWKRGLASPGLARSLVYLFSLICCHFPSTSKNHVSFHLRIFKKATLSPSEKMFLLPGCYLHCHIFFYLTFKFILHYTFSWIQLSEHQTQQSPVTYVPKIAFIIDVICFYLINITLS